MHPQLNSEHQHEGCAELMGILKDCHAENPLMRYLGVCNDKKLVLNKCFRAEVRPSHCQREQNALPTALLVPSPDLQRIERGKKNMEEARAKRGELEKKWKEIEQES
ncbi:hypothetical protein P7C70_g3632, partial [Phenoliferia sp. Uapishka_3]